MISVIDSQPAHSDSDLVEQVEQIFGPEGILSEANNFEYRPQQQAMATGVMRSLEANQNYVVEAGTGVGKSLAYLIPAILHGQAHVKKAIISTHTINLQEDRKSTRLNSSHALISYAVFCLKKKKNFFFNFFFNFVCK